MGDFTDYLASEFRSGELVLIAEKMGLAPTSQWGNRKLVDVIRKRIKDSGIPRVSAEDDNRASELLREFLYVAEYANEAGDTESEQGGGLDTKIPLEELLKQLNKSKPDCFSFGCDEDPACKRCPVYAHCAEERIANLPRCFGELYDANDVECEACMEAPYCKG